MTPEAWGIAIAGGALMLAVLGGIVKIVLSINNISGDVRVVKEHLDALNGRTSTNETNIATLDAAKVDSERVEILEGRVSQLDQRQYIAATGGSGG